MSGQKKSELSRRARIERKNRILSVPLSLSRARSFAKFSPLAMSQLTNSARASFSASMGSLGGATTPLVLVEIGAAEFSRRLGFRDLDRQRRQRRRGAGQGQRRE